MAFADVNNQVVEVVRCCCCQLLLSMDHTSATPHTPCALTKSLLVVLQDLSTDLPNELVVLENEHVKRQIITGRFRQWARKAVAVQPKLQLSPHDDTTAAITHHQNACMELRGGAYTNQSVDVPSHTQHRHPPTDRRKHSNKITIRATYVVQACMYQT